MKSVKILAALSLVALLYGSAPAQPGSRQPGWQPRWMLELSGNVFSPSGVDKNRFNTSLGGGLSLVYWITWDTQFLVSGTYSKLKTNEYYWLPFDPTDTTFSLADLNVRGNLGILSLEARKLFPSDRQNFLYLGVGVDYFSFGKIKGTYLRQDLQPANSPLIPGSFTRQRDPSWAAGAHLSPGLFFLIYPKVPIDITIRFNALYDGKNSMAWIEPAFAIGYRIR